MEELIIPGESVVNSSITTRIIKKDEGEYMIITMQHRIITITEPSEAKEIDLGFKAIP